MSLNEARTNAAHDAVRSLVAAKFRYLTPMTMTFMISYIGLTAVAGFAKSWMTVKVAGPLNLGFALIFFNYILSWALALIYERVANNVFDPLAAKAVAAGRESTT